MYYTMYKVATGEIVSSIEIPEFMLDANVEALGEGIASLEGLSNNALQIVDIYHEPHSIIDKTYLSFDLDKPTIMATGSDVATISGIREGVFVIFEGDDYEVVGGTYEFTSDVAGEFKMVLKHPMYLDAIVTVVAE